MFTALSTLALLIAAPLPPQPDFQRLADAAEWKWLPENVGPLYSLQVYGGDYQVDIVKKPNTFDKLTIRFSKDGKTALTLEGHYATGFVADGNILYYTEYHPSSSGCSVVAFDLAAGKELWKSHLKGIGPISHFKYRNLVTIDFQGTLRVFGHESAGDYVEFLDVKSGKTGGHKIFRKGFGQ